MGEDVDTAAFVKQTAIETGFDLVGISEAGRLEQEGNNLSTWLSHGYHAGMEWMNKNLEKRINPETIFEGARRVISLGKNYFIPVSHDEHHLKISRYAWGEDYHTIISGMLECYTSRLREKFPTNRFKFYCDTGPVMEKAWAQRGGIGWVGKHTNLINPTLGSWLFLSEVITDLDCKYDMPEADHCGTCRACIDACPTEAIIGPYILDSNRCISYLTIENRESNIPPEYSSRLDNWIFGCDVCQDVCPWNNKFQKQTESPEFVPRKESLNLNVEDVHLMTREEFSERFKRSPVRRAKFEGFKRNAAATRESLLEQKPKGNSLYKGFIFDLDGVLIDSSRIHYEGWRKVLQELGRDLDYGKFKNEMFGKRGSESLALIFGEGKFSAQEAKEISDRVDQNFVDTVAELGEPVSGAIEFVRVLHDLDKKVAMATSAPRQNVDAFLDAFSLRGVFTAEVSGDDVTKGKPDPEVFLKAASMLGVAPKDCVVFEDSLAGVTAAKAAGCVCVALLTTATADNLRQADYFIGDFHDESLSKIVGIQFQAGKKKLREKA